MEYEDRGQRRREALESARKKVVDALEASPQKVFRLSELRALHYQLEEFLPRREATSQKRFIDFLLNETPLRKVSLSLPSREEIRFIWTTATTLEIAQSLRSNSYLSHQTAAYFHGLSDTTPSLIYLNFEQADHERSSTPSQSAIDLAYKRNPRVSKTRLALENRDVVLVNGMWTGQLGVIETNARLPSEREAKARVTNLERTLIDISVRPAYAEGPCSVLSIYRKARHSANIERLASYLTKLRYVYPYHQAIGFYLQRAGFDHADVASMKAAPFEVDFYLAHGMHKTRYVKEWRLHIPDDLE